MSIVKMKRVKILVLEEQRAALLERLQRLGCVEISEPDDKLADPDWTALLSRGSSSLGEVRANTSAVSAAVASLKKYASIKNGLFRVRGTISEQELFSPERERSALAHAQAINRCTAEISQGHTREGRLTALQSSLQPWSTLDLPLETEHTETTDVILGTLSAAEDLEAVRGALAQAAPLSELMKVSSDSELHYVLLICHRSQWPEAQAALKPYSFSATHFRELTGTAAENLRQVEQEISQVQQRRVELEEEIRSHAGAIGEMEILLDRLDQDAAKEAAREKAMTDGTIVYLEGWATVPKLDKVEGVLKQFDAAYEFRDPLEGDDVPTLLDNPGWMKCINMVTEMYSLPAYNGIDPNPLMFFWYVFFFGFMFADVAYGIIIFAISAFVTKKYKPKGTLGYMFGLGQWLGASTAICGLFVGGFFGNVLDVFYQNFVPGGLDAMPGWMAKFSSGIIVNPVNDPMTVLILAIVIGCFHLLMGQCIHIYMGFRDHNGVDALLDVVPWWIVFAGIGVAVLKGTPVLLGISAIILICTQGRHERTTFGKIFGGVASLYDITSWLSDVLSYARLMALMLATSVIAQVFNTLGALPKMLIVFIIVFIIGHTFNIGVNLIGTYVHAARLQYLEYFGKFYVDGGIPFKPLKYNTKFVDITEEET